MKIYEQLSTEQLEKHRMVLLWMVASVDFELTRRATAAQEADQLELPRINING